MIWLFAETQKEMWLLASDWLAPLIESIGANPGGWEGCIPSIIQQHPPNIFRGIEKFPIRCEISLPNQDAKVLIMRIV